ncbi:MAG: hypothetical protein A3G34_16390 [Candidatus Lindowbacteria bacterium RIFCSPLOWO2_12_FULL_62_27]|nr:MAG: hypothetical protein A3G34_16390 [Candidatus Lindowbacteria bacterium RIFCSPLOWO2_12_FULL_62_27]
MTIVTVPKVLRKKLGEDGADALVDFFNAATPDTDANLRVMPHLLLDKLGDEAAKGLAEYFAQVKKENGRA